jgi:hypothetical protein
VRKRGAILRAPDNKTTKTLIAPLYRAIRNRILLMEDSIKSMICPIQWGDKLLCRLVSEPLQCTPRKKKKGAKAPFFNLEALVDYELSTRPFTCLPRNFSIAS